MRKNDRKAILDALEEIPFIDRACRKIGIHRSTFYRWQESDPEFRKKTNKALALGRESLCELAESMLVKKIKDGETNAIKFCLQNNSPIYTPKRTVFVLPEKKDTYSPEKGCDTCGLKPLSKEVGDKLRKNIEVFFGKAVPEKEYDPTDELGV